jgi:hypothetical protein
MSATALVQQLAEFFRQRAGVWIDGRELARIAGAYAWRTRVSDLRRPPFFLNIENRLRHVRVDGRAFTISEYRLREGRQEAEPDLRRHNVCRSA